MKERREAQVRSAFSGIIIAALLVAGLALAIGVVIEDTATTYNVSINATQFSNITSTGREIVSITNVTANNFFGNQTTTTGSSSIDRMISGAYGTILTIGEVPGVFTSSVSAVFSGIGLTGYENFVVAGILAIIIGIGIYLAVGRT